MLDILETIMNYSSDKRSTLLYFLDDKTSKQVEKYNLVESDNLYLNDSLICINCSTLEIEFRGIINLINDDKILLKFNNHSANINPDHYYKFIKNKNNKTDTRKFFQELLEKL